jgi:hypothetical protein
MNKGTWALGSCGILLLVGVGYLSVESPRALVAVRKAVGVAVPEATALVALAASPARAPDTDPATLESAAALARAKPGLFVASPLAVPSVSLDRLAQPNPVVRQRVAVRAVQAETLDRRLEGRIESLRQRVAESSGTERDALTADLATLEKNLAFRRRLENGAHGPAARPVSD